MSAPIIPEREQVGVRRVLNDAPTTYLLGTQTVQQNTYLVSGKCLTPAASL